MYVKRNIKVRSHYDLYHGNTTVLSLILLIHAPPCQPYNKYLTICVQFIVALLTSLPVTCSTLKASCEVFDIEVRLKQGQDFLNSFS